mmetsp:Transcript_51541/g.132961  ORF Transcript_51541/g.132961 Transcript_51541/m.132961 type:complete len:235 (-) Transcript_51541:603-1307(-)
MPAVTDVASVNQKAMFHTMKSETLTRLLIRTSANPFSSRDLKAATTTAARAASGREYRSGPQNSRMMTRTSVVQKLCSGVAAPDAPTMAVRESDAAAGKPDEMLPSKFAQPRAISSWLLSTSYPNFRANVLETDMAVMYVMRDTMSTDEIISFKGNLPISGILICGIPLGMSPRISTAFLSWSARTPHMTVDSTTTVSSAGIGHFFSAGKRGLRFSSCNARMMISDAAKIRNAM